MVLDVIILSILIIAVVYGYRKGLIRALTGVASFFVAFIMTAVLRTPFANFLYGSQLGQYIREKLVKQVEGVSISEQMPPFLKLLIGETADNALYHSAAAIAEAAARIVVDILAAVILLIVITVIVQLLAGLLRKVFDLPVLKTLDQLGGLALGGLIGLIIVFLLCAVLQIFMLSADSFWVEQLNSSMAAKVFFSNNPIVNWLR